MSRPLLELDHEHQEPDKARDNASLQLDRAILKLAGVLDRLRVVRPQDRAEQRDGRRVRCRPQVPCPAVAAFRVRAELRFSPDLRLSIAPVSSTPEHPSESAARGTPLQTLALWPRDPAVHSRSPKTGRIRIPVARPRPPHQLVMPPEASSSRLALPPFTAVVPLASLTPASASSRRLRLDHAPDPPAHGSANAQGPARLQPRGPPSSTSWAEAHEFQKHLECEDSFDYVGSSSSWTRSSSKRDLRQDDHFPGYHYYHCYARCLVSIACLATYHLFVKPPKTP